MERFPLFPPLSGFKQLGEPPLFHSSRFRDIRLPYREKGEINWIPLNNHDFGNVAEAVANCILEKAVGRCWNPLLDLPDPIAPTKRVRDSFAGPRFIRPRVDTLDRCSPDRRRTVSNNSRVFIFKRDPRCSISRFERETTNDRATGSDARVNNRRDCFQIVGVLSTYLIILLQFPA